MSKQRPQSGAATVAATQLAALRQREENLQAHVDRLEKLLEEAPTRLKQEQQVAAHQTRRHVPPPSRTKKERLSVQIQETDLEQLRRKAQRAHLIQVLLVLLAFGAFIVWVSIHPS